MATIYDVAREAKVSPKTVSRVLNGDAPVRKETRAAVERAMLDLGYFPSNAARTMRSNRSGLIGMITGALTHAPRSTDLSGLPEIFIVQGIQRRVAGSGKTLLIADTGGDSAQVPALIRTFTQHRVEGLFYVAANAQKIALPVLPQPSQAVLVNCYDDAGTPAVMPDDESGQKALVAHLIAQGHRRIGYVTLAPSVPAMALRIDGYRAALAAAGLGFDPALVVAGETVGDEDNAGYMHGVVGRLLALDNPPTAICCGNDRMAMRLYGILRSFGLSIPADISVAGYDDYRMISETLFPPLTTAELPYDTMGHVAAETLLAMIDDPADLPDENPRRVPGAIFTRGSTAPPAT